MSYQQKSTPPVPHKAAEVVQTDVDTVVSNTIMLTSGQYLKAAREARNMSIEDVAVQLKLTRQRIKEIETDNYSSGLAFTFIRGYLRAYAKLVGISPDEVILAFNALSIEDHRESILSTPKKSKLLVLSSLTWNWLMVLGIMVVALALFGGWRMQANQEVTVLSDVATESQRPILSGNSADRVSETFQPRPGVSISQSE